MYVRVRVSAHVHCAMFGPPAHPSIHPFPQPVLADRTAPTHPPTPNRKPTPQSKTYFHVPHGLPQVQLLHHVHPQIVDHRHVAPLPAQEHVPPVARKVQSVRPQVGEVQGEHLAGRLHVHVLAHLVVGVRGNVCE
jgi:hypothetical protein